MSGLDLCPLCLRIEGWGEGITMLARAYRFYEIVALKIVSDVDEFVTDV